MATLEAYPPAHLLLRRRTEQPLAVVGITHSQCCIVLRGRLRALRQAGFRVVLISGPGAHADKIAAEEDAEQLTIEMQRNISPRADFVSLLRLIRALRWLRPVLTEFSTPKAGLLGNIAAFLCRVPTRIYMLRGLRLETATGPKRLLLRWLEQLAAACAHVVVCNSESLRERALELGLAPENKLRLVGHGSSNGVDVDRFVPGPDTLRASLGIPPDAPVIGFVGRLTRDKGIPELIEAFNCVLERMPCARLLLVGWFDESEDKLSVWQTAQITAHPRIVHTGYVADAAPYYRAMDMMVLPTWREGFPNSALEAAASGVPVISTLTTGARDAVRPGITGLLVPPGNAAALADAIVELLSDPYRRQAMKRAARRFAIEWFDDSSVLGKTVELYRALLGRAKRRHPRRLVTDAAAAIQ